MQAPDSGYGLWLLAAIDALRLRDHIRVSRSTNPHQSGEQENSCSFVSIRGSGSCDPLQETFWLQVTTATATYGAGQTIDWGLPDPAHDDLLISAALLTTLDPFVAGSSGFRVMAPRRRPV